MKTHYTIPIFIPEKACPFRCVYCNQYSITNKTCAATVSEVKSTIDTYLTTFPKEAIKRVGFFGGSFTGMSIEEQNTYLDVVQPYMDDGLIHQIQLSTRPDYIDKEVLDNLKSHRVTIIELGAQSLDDNVLKLSGRGHTVEDVEVASKLINDYGFDLGLQMMIGLPGDNYHLSMSTADKIIALKAKYTRIYPTLVIKDSDLELQYRRGEYAPLSLEQAVEWSKDLMLKFEAAGVNILRVGLHPSEGLIDGTSLVAGPFHVSFKELVLTRIWRERIDKMVEGKSPDDEIVIEVSPSEINYAVGYGSANKNHFLVKYPKIKMKISI